MCQATAFLGERRAFRVYLPALMLFVSLAPSGCPGCRLPGLNLDLSGLALIQAAQDIQSAAQLHMLGRIIEGPAAKRLKEFGRADRTSGLGQARAIFDTALSDAERELRKKWPKARLKLRMVSESIVVTFYDEDLIAYTDISHAVERVAEDKVRDMISSLAELYPDEAKNLPDAESLQIRVGNDGSVEASPDATIELVEHFQIHCSNERPAGEFGNAEQLERARLRTDPYKATFRIVYEVMAEEGSRRRPPSEPVLALEVVTLSFEFRGERWELPGDKKKELEDAK